MTKVRDTLITDAREPSCTSGTYKDLVAGRPDILVTGARDTSRLKQLRSPLPGWVATCSVELPPVPVADLKVGCLQALQGYISGDFSTVSAVLFTAHGPWQEDTRILRYRGPNALVPATTARKKLGIVHYPVAHGKQVRFAVLIALDPADIPEVIIESWGSRSSVVLLNRHEVTISAELAKEAFRHSFGGLTPSDAARADVDYIGLATWAAEAGWLPVRSIGSFDDSSYSLAVIGA